MKLGTTIALLATALAAGSASAQADNPDFRIRAQMRTPNDGLWASNESMSGADFRIHSRFLQLYYGGVHRNDEFKFQIQLDFTSISGFDTNFAASPYNTDYDAYINNHFVGRVDTNAQTFGVAELVYDSRHPSFPELPLPANFPDPVNTFDTVRLFAAATTLPAIGDPLPAGTAIFTADLIERFDRGDANQDGKVNLEDYDVLAAVYDPYHLLGAHVGPAAGDFTGENLADHADYALLVQNWTDSKEPPEAPAPVATPSCYPDFDRDGFVTGDDFDAFVTAFENGSLAADFIPDGFITGDDFDSFVTAFEAGC